MDEDHTTVSADPEDIEEALAVRDAAIVQLTIQAMYLKREIVYLREQLADQKDEVTKH